MQKRVGKKNSWTKIEQHLKLNEYNKIRRHKYLDKIIKGKNKILEVGCSSGFMLFDLKKKVIFVMELNLLVFFKNI